MNTTGGANGSLIVKKRVGKPKVSRRYRIGNIKAFLGTHLAVSILIEEDDIARANITFDGDVDLARALIFDIEVVITILFFSTRCYGKRQARQRYALRFIYETCTVVKVNLAARTIRALEGERLLRRSYNGPNGFGFIYLFCHRVIIEADIFREIILNGQAAQLR